IRLVLNDPPRLNLPAIQQGAHHFSVEDHRLNVHSALSIKSSRYLQLPTNSEPSARHTSSCTFSCGAGIAHSPIRIPVAITKPINSRNKKVLAASTSSTILIKSFISPPQRQRASHLQIQQPIRWLLCKPLRM